MKLISTSLNSVFKSDLLQNWSNKTSETYKKSNNPRAETSVKILNVA